MPPPSPDVCSSFPYLAQANNLNSDIEALAGASARLAWVRAQTLMRMDTSDGKGECAVETGKNVSRPVITPTGRQIVFICYPEWTSYIVDWDGGNLHCLLTGRVTHVRMDEKGREWAYWQTPSNEIMTARLDAPDRAVSVWKFPYPARENKTEDFQTSADGRRAASSIPWPQVGCAALPGKPGADFVNYGVGCWPQIARDNSYRVFHLFTGKHNRLAIYDHSGTQVRFIPCLPNPKRSGCETPRWANDPRFVVGTDQSWHELPPDVYLGRFNEKFTEFERWIRITREGNNSEPDCWIKSASRYPQPATNSADIAGSSGAGNERSWPGPHTNLSFLWEDLGAKNLIHRKPGVLHRRCVTALRGTARPRYFGSVDLSGGYMTSEGLDGTFIEEIRSSCALSVEFVISPAGAGKGTILSFGPAGGLSFFAVEQANDSLTLLVKPAGNTPDGSGNRIPLGRLAGSARNERFVPAPLQHVVVTITSGKASFFVNGECRMASADIDAAFDTWQPGQLFFGCDPSAENRWNGVIEGVAVFSSLLTGEEVARHNGMYAMKFAARGVNTSVRKVQATLLEKTSTPTLDQIQPYPRALVAYRYKIESVVNGKPTTEEIEVDHWAWLDSKKIIVEREIGQTCNLKIEPASWYTTLKYERIMSTLENPPEKTWMEVLP